jgi:hypothetical protein
MTGSNPADSTGHWANIPSSQDDSRTLLGQTAAVLVGIAATVLGLWLAYVGLGQLKNTIGHLIWLLISLYVIGVVAQFWVAQSYKNGMSGKEITYALLWPIDVVRSIRRGVKAAASNVPGRAGYASDDNGPKVITEGVAFAIGIAATVLAAILFFVGIASALAVIWSAIWLLIIAWIVGGIVQFWVAASWRDGLTVKELTMAAIWPLGMASVIRAGVEKFRQP